MQKVFPIEFDGIAPNGSTYFSVKTGKYSVRLGDVYSCTCVAGVIAASRGISSECKHVRESKRILLMLKKEDLNVKTEK